MPKANSSMYTIFHRDICMLPWGMSAPEWQLQNWWVWTPQSIFFYWQYPLRFPRHYVYSKLTFARNKEDLISVWWLSISGGQLSFHYVFWYEYYLLWMSWFTWTPAHKKYYRIVSHCGCLQSIYDPYLISDWSGKHKCKGWIYHLWRTRIPSKEIELELESGTSLSIQSYWIIYLCPCIQSLIVEVLGARIR